MCRTSLALVGSLFFLNNNNNVEYVSIVILNLEGHGISWLSMFKMVQNDRRPSGLTDNSIFFFSQNLSLFPCPTTLMLQAPQWLASLKTIQILLVQEISTKKSNARFNFNLFSVEEATVVAKSRKVTSGQVKKNPTSLRNRSKM